MPVCAQCGQENPEGFRLCGMCGAPLAAAAETAREERKVVTVLFCDLVGSTARAERLDPEDVRALLSPYYARLRSELERHGGTVEKFIGDAVMAVFGAPLAHEDDAERAVRAALAIREAITALNAEDPELDLHVRIGINTGEALVALGARPIAGEGMVAGDVVNTAARLQAAAPVDGILVGVSTRRATVAAISYREAEPVLAKGKSEALPVWEAVEARSRVGVDVAPAPGTPLVGREQELALLLGALARTRRERSTQLVTLVGVPGIGKSRLVTELMERVDADPELIFWRQGRSLPYGEGVSYWALGEMVKAQAGILETDSDEEAGEKLRATVAPLLEGSDDAPWVERHLRPLVGFGRSGEGGTDRQEAFAAWRRFFEALAETGPAVLVFEDLHWADDGLLDFVDHLVDWAGAVPLLVVCMARPELLSRRPGWGGGKPNATTISLSPLADDETARLIGLLFERSVLPAELQRALLERAEGNPLYAEEFVRLARERGLSELEGLPPPETVQGIIAARLDGLSADEKELVQDASVLGKIFWLGALAAIADVERRTAEELLHGLERRQFVRRERRSTVGGEIEYAFVHVLVRDVAYGQMPRARRAERHRHAAEWISSLGTDRLEDRSEMLAHHYLAALEFARAAGQDTAAIEVPAREALQAAGDRALSLGSYPAAVHFYEEAVALCSAGDRERPRLLLRYGRARYLQGVAGAEVLAQARDLLLAAGDVEEAAEAQVVLSEIAWHEGNTALASERAQQARELLEPRAPSREKAYVLANVSRLHMLAGHDAESIEAGREALEMADELDLPAIRAHALNNIGCARASRGDPEGLKDLEASIAIAEEINSPPDIGRGYINLAALTGPLGDFRRCRELHLLALEVSERYGMGGGLRFLQSELTLDEFLAGEWDAALRDADEFIAEIEGGSPHYLEPQSRVVRAAIRLGRGDISGALDDSEKGLSRARAAKDPQALVPSLAEHARTLLLAGRAEEAGATAAEAVATLRRLGNPMNVSYCLVPLALVLEAVGRPEELVELAEAAHPTPFAAAALSCLRGDCAAAAESLRQAGSLSDEAYMRLRAAEAHVAARRRADADRELGRALEFYRSVDATRFVREGEALLASTA